MRVIPDEEALAYHSGGRRGKLEVVPSKPCTTQRDLSLAYTPGVAVPCRRIAADPSAAWEYTARGNLVAVISNGTAVLGLGNIGALAGKPVMEGKAVLFKRFADIDVFDLELDTTDPDEFVRTVRMLEPTFGGINLEDVRSPECFVIEKALRETMRIPVLHDDQHGTAIISGAALLNALEVVGKDIADARVVFCGAGAAGIACARYYLQLGVRRENLVLCDKDGVVYRGREAGMHPFLVDLAADTPFRSLRQAVAGADVLVGLSTKGVVDAAMLKSMADRPIVFAMANPDPEITWEEARAARPDALLATGRSDYPNQVNNVLGFPFIFRGALDVRATAINEEMKLAATRALAALAREDVPDSVMRAYGLERLHFGPDYLIPKPFDQRVLVRVASEVARAAMESGVATRTVDVDEYREHLYARLGRRQEVMRSVVAKARRAGKRIVFPEGSDPKILRASQVVRNEGIGIPVLLGRIDDVERAAAELEIDLHGVTVLDPRTSPRLPYYADVLYEKRQRKGVTRADAGLLLRRDFTYFGALMVETGDADALVAGVSQHYPDTLRPALQVIGTRPGVSRVSGVYMMLWRDRILFLGDTTVNIDPTAEQLAEVAVLASEVARRFMVEPRVGMVSFSNFGSVEHPSVEKVQRAVRLVRERAPGLVVDGEVQADMAVTPELMREHFPFSPLAEGATVLVFSSLASANASYKLLARLGGAEAVGPILMGMNKPVHVLQYGVDVRDIVHMAAIAAADAYELDREAAGPPAREPELREVPVPVGGGR
jgi:malate dehydrogenase (oxaloacetate-decarboxylating)(NADP+)